MGERDLFAGAGDQVAATTAQGQTGRAGGGQRDNFSGAGDRDAGQTTTGHLPGDLHSVWAQSNCDWRPDKDTTHPAVQAWRAASREHWHDPIKLDCDGYYTVKNPDCLDSIASRVIETTTGKPPTHDQLVAEKDAIKQANHEHYPGIMDCNPDFLGNGWKLVLPGLKAADNCQAPQEPPAKVPPPEPPARQPVEPAPPPPERQPRPHLQRQTEGTITIDNEPGGTVTIHEGAGGDCHCGPPPPPLDGRQQFSDSQPRVNLEPPPPPPPQPWGRSLAPQGEWGAPQYFTGPPNILIAPRFEHRRHPGEYVYEGPPPGWNGQPGVNPNSWTTQPNWTNQNTWNNQPNTWNTQPNWSGQAQPHIPYWQYQQMLHIQQQRQRAAYVTGQPSVSITANIGNGSDWNY